MHRLHCNVMLRLRTGYLADSLGKMQIEKIPLNRKKTIFSSTSFISIPAFEKDIFVMKTEKLKYIWH